MYMFLCGVVKSHHAATAPRPSTASTIPLCSSQRKPVVVSFPQTQSHQLLVYPVVYFWPKRANDVFAGRCSLPKFLRFQIQVPVLPRPDRFVKGVLKSDEIVKRSSAV